MRFSFLYSFIFINRTFFPHTTIFTKNVCFGALKIKYQNVPIIYNDLCYMLLSCLTYRPADFLKCTARVYVSLKYSLRISYHCEHSWSHWAFLIWCFHFKKMELGEGHSRQSLGMKVWPKYESRWPNFFH